ncbi:MAG: hypothetical protein Q9184_004542 [Pyrenodesmia sp. 2 TL-2023]
MVAHGHEGDEEAASLSLQPPKCVDTPERGYECQPQISQHWGQYSPFFTVPSNIPDVLPPDCNITFAQVLLRHGARDPTASKTNLYRDTIQKLKANVQRFSGEYAFLDSFTYTLGADQLTVFGEREMINSGIAFYDRYERLANRSIPFTRASGEERVVKSAQNFTQGFHQARTSGKQVDASFPYPILEILEGDGFNNTLNHGLCTEFEDNETFSSIGNEAQQTFLATFLPSVTARLNADLVGANLTATDTINLMDLCPFTTVASSVGTISPFCNLFTEDEWHHYDYYQTLGKYYGYGPGNPLGPTQGVGFVNELIARMTGKPVNDHTTVNRTLDDSLETFPLSDALYVDVSHDNDMTAIFSALGLYNGSIPLSKTFIDHRDRSKGYSAAWTVPFAGRAYFEKMKCRGKKEELVRIIVNGRVLPLETISGLILIFVEVPLLLRICPTSERFDVFIRRFTTNYMRAAMYTIMSVIQWLSLIRKTTSLVASAVLLLAAAICYLIAGLKGQGFVGSKTLGGQGVAQMIV